MRAFSLRLFLVTLLSVMAWGCGGSSGSPDADADAGDAADADPDRGSDADRDTEPDAPADADRDTEADAPADGDLDAPPDGADGDVFEGAWAGSFGGDGEDVVRFVSVGPAGAVYTTGYFTDTADFDAGEGTDELESAGFYDVFVQKTAPSGEHLWARSFGGPTFDYGTAVVADAAGNVYVTGVFEESADFDPSDGERMLTSEGMQDIFVVKLDRDGALLWAKRVGGVEYDESTAVGVDDLGNVYVSGYFHGAADFDPSDQNLEIAPQGQYGDSFVLKLGPEGDLIWARTYGGDHSVTALAMDVTGGGTVHVAGMFESTVDFDPGDGEAPLTPPTASKRAAYHLALDTSGNYLGAGHMGGSQNVLAYDIAVDGTGNIYLSGVFAEEADFDPGPAEALLTSEGFDDGFLLKLNPSFELEWVGHLASPDDIVAYDVSVDAEGHLYATGFFLGTADLDPTAQGDHALTNDSGNAFAAYLTTVDPEGTFVQAWSFGGVNFSDYHGGDVDSEGAVYLSGAFENTVDLSLDPEVTDEATSNGFRDSYIIRFVAD